MKCIGSVCMLRSMWHVAQSWFCLKALVPCRGRERESGGKGDIYLDTWTQTCAMVFGPTSKTTARLKSKQLFNDLLCAQYVSCFRVNMQCQTHRCSLNGLCVLWFLLKLWMLWGLCKCVEFWIPAYFVSVMFCFESACISDHWKFDNQCSRSICRLVDSDLHLCVLRCGVRSPSFEIWLRKCECIVLKVCVAFWIQASGVLDMLFARVLFFGCEQVMCVLRLGIRLSAFWNSDKIGYSVL